MAPPSEQKKRKNKRNKKRKSHSNEQKDSKESQSSLKDPKELQDDDEPEEDRRAVSEPVPATETKSVRDADTEEEKSVDEDNDKATSENPPKRVPTDDERRGKDHDPDGRNEKNSNSESVTDKAEETESKPTDADVGVMTETTFESLGVCEPLCKACDRLGWKYASRIQERVLPEALQDRDIIGLAETGSGKTGAFCIPLLQALLENPVRGAVFGVILAPTRELAFQIHQVVEALGFGIGATSVCIVGGVPTTQQSIALGRNPHVIVATPGRLLDHLTNTKGFHLRKLRFLVLDEADRMLSLDFEQELNELLEVIPEKRRTLLFSATMTSKVEKLQRACLSDPVKVEVSTKFQTPKQLLQSYLFIPAKYKDCYLTYLVHEHAGQSILVFGATCNNVQRLALMLRNLGFPAICLHGQMSQPKRLGALQKFTGGSRSILICTDVASRGLDIPQVDLVINFDLPGHGKDYIHRVGRTARAGKSGKAIAMVTQYDVEVYQRLEGLLGNKLPEYKLEEETVLVLLERVNEAQRLATREVKEQLAAAAAGSGGRRKRKPGMGVGDDDELNTIVQKEIRRGYAGGSGGRGGALPNQRGSGKQSKKYRRK